MSPFLFFVLYPFDNWIDQIHFFLQLFFVSLPTPPRIFFLDRVFPYHSFESFFFFSISCYSPRNHLLSLKTSVDPPPHSFRRTLFLLPFFDFFCYGNLGANRKNVVLPNLPASICVRLYTYFFSCTMFSLSRFLSPFEHSHFLFLTMNPRFTSPSTSFLPFLLKCVFSLGDFLL